MSETISPFERRQRHLHRSALETNNLLSKNYWTELRTFLAVAKAKSFNRAAELLGISQPTVSRQMRRLNDVIGTQLFIPTTQGVLLTPKGEEFAEALAALDYRLSALAEDIRGETKGEKGLVRLSVTEGIASVFVVPGLTSFSSMYPDIQFQIRNPLSLINLRDNHTDMMIGFTADEEPDSVFRPLGVIHFIPMASKSYIAQNGLPTRVNIAQHRFVQSEYYLGQEDVWRPWNNAVAQGAVSHFCDSTFAYTMLAKAGHGIALLGSYAALDPEAVPLDLGIEIKVPLYIVALAERLKSRPVQIAFDWLCERLSLDNPWLSREFALPGSSTVFDREFMRLYNLSVV